MHRIETGQSYSKCRGGNGYYPEHVTVLAHEPGARTVEVHDLGGTFRYTIPASYFHPTRRTAAGRRRITGYYLTGTQDD